MVTDRLAEIEARLEKYAALGPDDGRWLLSEVRRLRTVLEEIVHNRAPSNGEAIRERAEDALGLSSPSVPQRGRPANGRDHD